MKILLMGNPNVGKSALFSRLTGTKVIASNYPGTTIEFTRGVSKVWGERPRLSMSPAPTTWSLPQKRKRWPPRCLRKAT